MSVVYMEGEGGSPGEGGREMEMEKRTQRLTDEQWDATDYDNDPEFVKWFSETFLQKEKDPKLEAMVDQAFARMDAYKAFKEGRRGSTS